jgi:hypothetical protein
MRRANSQRVATLASLARLFHLAAIRPDKSRGMRTSDARNSTDVRRSTLRRQRGFPITLRRRGHGHRLRV